MLTCLNKGGLTAKEHLVVARNILSLEVIRLSVMKQKGVLIVRGMIII